MNELAAPASALTVLQLPSSLGRAASVFEKDWSPETSSRALDAALPAPDSSDRLPLLVELCARDLGLRLVHGLPACAEDYLARYPELRDHPAAVRNLVGAERELRDRDTLSSASRPLPRVPGYDVLGELGAGGMGVVYKARHLSLNRVVALKLLRPSVLPRDEARNRFRVEALAAARLDHPHIAHVYEVGIDHDTPYLAMEYVEGVDLCRRLAGKPLAPREAAALGEALARAVQHAHDHGVVHRDLKPANILLVACGLVPGAKPQAALVPKIVDYGLAKFLDADDGQTHTGAVLGTPAYMAPEQAAGASRDVGSAADIFALGVILYECLAGHPPFRAETRSETLRQVQHDDPPPLDRAVPRDLDTICLKCLEKAPGRRYASAKDLADDLERFLAGEAVVARRPGALRRFATWGGRHPRAAAAALAGALLAAAALVAAPTFSALWWRAETQRERGDYFAQLSLDALDKPAVNIAERGLLRKAGLLEVEREILEAVVPLYERFLERAGNNPTALAAKGRVWNKLAVVYRALGNLEAALKACHAAEDIFAEFAGRPEPEAADRFALATARSNKAAVLGRWGRFEEALAAAGAAEAALTELADEDRGRPDYRFRLVLCLNNKALCLRFSGDPPAARAAFDRALENLARLTRDHAQSAQAPTYREWQVRTLNNLGDTLLAAGRPGEAEPMLREAVRLAEEQAATLVGSEDAQDALAGCLVNAASLYESKKEFTEAETTNDRGRAVYTALAARFPQAQEYRWGVALTTLGRGKARRQRGDHDRAAADLTAALKDYDRLVLDYPNEADIAKERGEGYAVLAELLLARGRRADAEAAAVTSVAALEKLTQEVPDGAECRRALDEYRRLLDTIRGAAAEAP